MSPPANDALLVLFLDDAKARVPEANHCLATLFGKPVLHIIGNRLGHEQRAREFKQRGALDRLHMGPEMAVVSAQIPEPASAWPRLELERHRRAIGSLVERTELV